MKSIGLVIHSESSQGGIDQYAKSMVDALSLSDEFELILFTNQDDTRFEDYNCQVRTFSKKENSVFERIILGLSLLFGFVKNKYLSEKECQIFKDIDLFLCPTTSLYPHFFLNKPFVFTLHDLQERYFPNFFSIRERLRRYLVKKNLCNTSVGIICENKSVKEDIKKFIGISGRKIHVIPAPPPKTFFNYKIDKKSLEEVKKKYNINYKYLFYPAHTWYHKNHLRLLEAFNSIKNKFCDINLIFTGAKKNNFENIQRKINNLNLNNRVYHLGYVDYKDLPYIYGMSEMLVMPTLFESISIPIYEAFSLKLPVCCSNVTGLPEQVGNAGIIFDPYDVEDIAKKISNLLANKELASELGRKGYEKISKMNHVEYSRKLNSIIKKAITENN